MSKLDRDALDRYHEHGIHIPTRTITLDGEINHESTGRFLRNLHILQQDGNTAINIHINSEGGVVQYALAMYDAIRLCPVQVVARVVGTCESAATVILQAADFRVIRQNTLVMYHAGTVGQPEMGPAEAATSFMHELRVGKKADDIVFLAVKNQRPRLSRHRFDTAVARGLYLSGDDIIEWGLADDLEKA
jgi:ATP-dependent protease ClpP protease subunit